MMCEPKVIWQKDDNRLVQRGDRFDPEKAISKDALGHEAWVAAEWGWYVITHLLRDLLPSVPTAEGEVCQGHGCLNMVEQAAPRGPV